MDPMKPFNLGPSQFPATSATRAVSPTANQMRERALIENRDVRDVVAETRAVDHSTLSGARTGEEFAPLPVTPVAKPFKV